MKKKVVLGLMLTLLLNGMLILAFNVLSVTANLSISLLSPVFDYDDGLMRPDIISDYLSEGSPPGYRDTSEYLIGEVAVGVIFLESNGSIDEPSTENWTSTEESQVISEITAGLDWLAGQNPDAGVSFIFDVHYRVPTGYEPITRPHTNDNLWISEAMTSLGYSGTYYFAQVRDYINALRSDFDTDWSFAIFVVDSSNDPDGCFTDWIDPTRRWSAFAYLGGPFFVMTYDNGGYGIWKMDFVTAHEACHIFYATDEYNGRDETSGYLGVQDHEGSGCMMELANSWWLCQASKEQLGWRDTDGDGIQDIVDTFPDTTLNPYSLGPTIDTILTYTGSVVEIPYPNNNPKGKGRDVTINTITDVEFRVDFGSWMNTTPTDGAFDEDEENFAFTTPLLSEGTHTIETRGINSVGNIEISYASDEVTIVTNYYEVELVVPGDLPELEAEPDVVVKGNVKSTPRYGTEFEAWANGAWESPFDWAADTTLADRFIVSCTEEKAIALSTYTWVEWTAPGLPGTVYDGEVILGVRAAFFATPGSGVAPLTVNFTDLSASYDGITDWEWDFNDDGTVDSNATSPIYVYEQGGLYTVSLTVYEADGDNDTETKLDYIDVNQPPVADANGPYTETEGEPITFDGSGSEDPDGAILSYFWDFDDGQTSTEQNPTQTYSQNGTYAVTLTVTDDDSATDTDTTTATVTDTNPTADFSATPTSGLEPLTVGFTDLSTSYDGITTWEWDFNNDGVVDSTEQNPTYVYMQDGSYPVTLRVYESDGDSDTEIKVNYVMVTDTEPNADFSATSTSGLEPLQVNFTDFSTSHDGIISWNWSFGDGETSTEQNPIHLYAADGTYPVSLTVSEADEDSSTETKFSYIIVHDSTPVASFTYSPSNPLEGNQVTFNASGSTGYDQPLSYTWNFSDGTLLVNLTDPIVTHTYAHSDSYDVILTVVDSDGSTDSTYQTITVEDRDPVADFSATPTSGLEPLTVGFTDLSTSYDGITTWEWDFNNDDVIDSTEGSPTHTYTNEGTYSVSLTVYEADGDSATDTTTITVLLDTDGDLIPDTTDFDDDNDGIQDDWEILHGLNPLDPSDASLDPDGDGLTNLQEYQGGTDPNVSDVEVLLDTDGDETPDVTDTDDDNDGVLDVDDAFPLDPTETVDTDGDGVGNNADTNDDNDGVPDVDDTFPLDASESVDTDGDLIGNNADTDDDNDEMPDMWETENGLNPLDAADASLDPDGDGLTNLQEYQGDTDPNVSDAQAFPWWVLGAVAALMIGWAVAATFLWRRIR